MEDHERYEIQPPRVPTSWAEINELLLAYDPETKDLYERFGASARKLLFGDEALNASEKDELWRVSVKAVLALSTIDPGKFPPPTEDEMRAAWASALDGRELEPTPRQEVPNAP